MLACTPSNHPSSPVVQPEFKAFAGFRFQVRVTKVIRHHGTIGDPVRTQLRQDGALNAVAQPLSPWAVSVAL